MNASIVDTYSEIKRSQKGKFRSALRCIALDALGMVDTLSNAEDLLTRPRIQFLYIHHIFKDEVANFEKIVAYLSKGHTFISHSEAVHRLLTDTIDKPYIAWSSDDGIENNVLAAEVLNQYGAKCCFYINPYSIGLTDVTQIAKFCKEKLEMPPVAFLNWEQVGQLQEQGHEIGNHTFKHDKVSELSTDAFKADFIRADEMLTKNCGPIAHFAYTYGKFEHFNKTAFDFVFERGYDSCTSAVRGCHVNGRGPLQKEDVFLRRDQLVGDWKLSHIKHFLVNSAKQADYYANFLPESYHKQNK